MKKFMTAFVVLCAVSSLFAYYTETVNGITWTYTLSDGKASVGGGSSASTAVPTSTAGAITIPDKLGGYLVTSIGERAFSGCSELTSVTIPGRVTSIGRYAFYHCGRLKAVYISDLAAWCRIDFGSSEANPLNYAHNLYLDGALITNLSIPDGVTRIGSKAFLNCSGFTSVTIPGSVTDIGGAAFSGCTNLSSVAGSSDALQDGTLLIPSTLMNVESSAFTVCEKLKRVKIAPRKSRLTISGGAFDPALKEIRVEKLSDWLLVDSQGTSGNIIGCHSYSGEPNWVALYVADKICEGNLVISGKDGEKIGDGAFWGYTNLTSVTICDGVKYIGDSAFRSYYFGQNYTSIASVSIASSVRHIGSSAFEGCEKLKAVYIDDLAAWCGIQFDNDEDEGTSYRVRVSSQGANPLESGADLYVNGVRTENLVVPAAVATINAYAFAGCKSIVTVSLPTGLTKIGKGAFKNCENVHSIVIPKGVTDIETFAFRGCSGLLGATLPDGVRNLGARSFDGCASLAGVSLPASVANVGMFAFVNCSSLKAVYFAGNAPTVASIYSGAAGTGSGATANVTTYVPQGSIGWSGDPDSSDLPETWEGMPILHGKVPSTYTITLCSDGVVGRVVRNVGASVGTLPIPVKSGCEFLGWFTAESGGALVDDSCVLMFDTTLYAGWGAELTIENGVLTGVTVNRATSISIPNGVTSIGSYAFYSCEGLISVIIPDSVTKIDYAAFQNSGLTSVKIPISVTNIGMYAFNRCGNLSYVSLPKWFDGTLDSSVFQYCSGGLVMDYYNPYYTIFFHRNDASSGSEAAYDFDYGVRTRLPTLKSLGWARRGYDFKGWATSAANAAKGIVWASDWGIVSKAAEPGEVLDVYAVWALKDGFYEIYFVRNDGAGTWRTVAFPYGEKTRMPTLAKGLGWARRGYDFNGWALSAANANNNVIWKGDWGYVATPVAAGSTLTAYASWSLKPGFYQIRFNKNDGTGKWRTLGFECGASAKLNTITGLGWTRAGHPFKGWASNKANADAGKAWKTDGAWVKDATAEGKTLSIYAIWD